MRSKGGYEAADVSVDELEPPVAFMPPAAPPETWLEKIRERVNKATPGPWDVHVHSHIEIGCRCLSCHEEATGCLVDHPQANYCDDNAAAATAKDGKLRDGCMCGPLLSWEDADFAAHAREDVPLLLAEIDRLRGI